MSTIKSGSNQVIEPRIIFMGTPDFAVPALDALVANSLKPIAVVTAPDKPRGRGRRLSPTPVKEAAVRHGISPILEPENVKDPDFAEQIRNLRADIQVVVAFRILPPAVYEAARLGSFNLHGSLLPAYRGAAPINRAIMAGETRTGVTTFFLQEKVDTGGTILSRSMDIGPEETAGEVHDRMMHLGAEVVVETVQRILDGKAHADPQDDTKASGAPKIFKEDCHIDWSLSSREIHDVVRGLSPIPGAWSSLAGKTWKIYRTRPAAPGDTVVEDQPGLIEARDSRLWAGCRKGAVQILELQQEGRKRLSAEDVLRGHSFETGDRFE